MANQPYTASFTIPKSVNPATKVFINQMGGLIATHVSEAKRLGNNKLIVEIVIED